jgi:hypothetical protein
LRLAARLLSIFSSMMILTSIKKFLGTFNIKIIKKNWATRDHKVVHTQHFSQIVNSFSFRNHLHSRREKDKRLKHALCDVSLYKSLLNDVFLYFCANRKSLNDNV